MPQRKERCTKLNKSEPPDNPVVRLFLYLKESHHGQEAYEEERPCT